LFVSRRNDLARFCRRALAVLAGRIVNDEMRDARRLAQSRNNSLIEVFARVFSSTRLTITAQ
jgi:hypothetical protein